MRHIRDPITGLCIICEKNNIRHFVAPNELDDPVSSVHGSDQSNKKGRRGNDPGKKTIYVSAYPSSSSPSPTPRRPSSATSSESLDSFGDSTDTARKSRLSTRSPSKVALVERSPAPPPAPASPRNRSPSPTGKKRNKSPSPTRGRKNSPDAESGCCKRCCRGRAQKSQTSRSRVFDETSSFRDRSNRCCGPRDGTDRCCGYRNFETASFGAGTWGIRRWCAPCMVLLALMALAGLATGIYFGVKSAQTKQQQQQQVINYIKGQSQLRYVIVGVDQPCNKNDNNSLTGTTVHPNCKSITTRIVVPNKNFVAPTDPDWLLALSTISASSRVDPFPAIAVFGLVWFVRLMGLFVNFVVNENWFLIMLRDKSVSLI